MSNEQSHPDMDPNPSLTQRRLEEAWGRRNTTEPKPEADPHRPGAKDDSGKREQFFVGDLVYKTGGDYSFDGTVVASFLKHSGERRYVVEDSRGLLYIFSAKSLLLGKSL